MEESRAKAQKAKRDFEPFAQTVPPLYLSGWLLDEPALKEWTCRMKVPLHVLIADDSEEDARLLLHLLKRNNYEVTYERVETAEALKQALERETWDIILSDYSFPRFSGQAALRIVQESGLDLPFIYVSGTIGEDVAVEAMKAGAQDYVMKHNLARLGPAVEREMRDATERKQLRYAEEAMRVSESKYRHLLENMNDAALLVEMRTGRIIDSNRQAEVLLGRTRESILGMKQDSLFPPTEERDLCAFLAECSYKNHGCDTETLRQDGVTVPVHLNVSSVELYGRNCLLALFRDLSEHQRATADAQTTHRRHSSVS